MSKETLKPCPFCGTKAYLSAGVDAACTNYDCHASIGVWRDLNKNIAAWNRRTPTETDKLKDAVVEAAQNRFKHGNYKKLAAALSALHAHLDKREGE